MLVKLFGQDPKGVKNATLTDVIPSLPVSLLSDIRQQPYYLETWFYATGAYGNNPDSAFPIIIKMLESNDANKFNLHISYLAHVGGMFTVNSDGIIQNGNDTFLTVMFGYHLTDIIGKPVITLLPDFEDIMEQSTAMVDVDYDDSPSSKNSKMSLSPGSFEMTSQHYDGGCFRVIVQIREQPPNPGEKEKSYTLWITQSDSPVIDLVNSLNLSGSPSTNLAEKDSKVNQSTAALSNNIEITSIYEFGKLLGAGSYGSVNVAKNKKDGKEVSIKTINKKKIIKEFLDEEVHKPKEILVMKKLNHPQVIKFIDSFESVESFYIVMEYFTNCIDLFQFIDERKKMKSC
jgi:serine/threonine protein kinase